MMSFFMLIGGVVFLALFFLGIVWILENVEIKNNSNRKDV